ncbi:hypothetical protein HPB50_025966 [Hyalomma asiaticum]|uniref:Uncharacterized protein n=1 Tax=Hyalomma asiaticum TaxID=266040 RepID=A0ACB7T234_HYAAI|nr:hypothetical protein HPB50_025966 [Hyalomma asiaticum]
MVVEQQQQQQQGGTQSSEEENDVQFRHIACRPASSNKPSYTPPQINELKSQLTNFIAHVKNNCISHADLENLPGRKKPRTQSKKAFHSNSPERENTNDPTHQRKHIRLLTHNYDGSEEDLLQKLCEKLRGPTQPATTLPSYKEYEGLPNADLDRPFTLAELHAAIARLTRKTSPGKDRIVNKHLRQLPNKALTALLQYYNECCDKGELPASWKHSETWRTFSVLPARCFVLRSDMGLWRASLALRFSHQQHSEPLQKTA